MFKLTPSKNAFYGHFTDAADLVARGARAFADLLAAPDLSAADDAAQQIDDLEEQLDNVVHETFRLLHQSFITPIERGDIRRLVQGLDNILDSINAAVKRIQLYEVRQALPGIRELADVLVEAAEAVQQAVAAVPHLRDRATILQHCVRINQLENDADKVHRRTLADLFKTGLDPLMVIKWKEILEFVEDATDRCEEVADIVEGIVLENG